MKIIKLLLKSKYLIILIIIGIGILQFLPINKTSAVHTTYYWVGNGGAFSDPANWSTTSGGAGGSGPPNSGSDVVFDSNSGDATITATITVEEIRMDATYVNQITVNDSVNLTINDNFTASGGTFLAGNGTYAFGGDGNFDNTTISGATVNLAAAGTTTIQRLTINSGEFIAPSATLTIPGAKKLTVTGGNFTHSNGTVVMSYQSGGSGLDTAIDIEFYNLTISLAVGWYFDLVDSTTSTTRTVTIANDLNITSGKLNGTLHTVNLQGDLLSTNIATGNTQAINLTGSNSQNITLAAGDVADWDSDITINKTGGSVNLGADLTLNANNQDLIIAEGTFDLAGNALTVNGTSGTFVIQDGGNLQLQGDETPTTPTLNTGSTVTYDGTGTYTVKDWGYHHLAFNNASGIYNLGAAESLAGNLTITNGIFDVSGFDLTVTGTFSNDGTLRLQGDETLSLTNDTNSGIIEYDGGASYASLAAGNNYYSLTFNGSGTWAQNATLDVNGNLTITSGTLNSAGNAITLAGNWSNSGTYTHGSNTVTLDGTNQTLTGSTTFNALTKTVVSADTLTFTEAQTFTFAGTLTLQGASGQLLSLRSTTNGQAVNLNPQGTRNVEYLDVKDMNNTNATAISCITGCVDSLNNTNWTFVAAGVTVSAISGNTTEAGGTATFTVVLDTEPSNNVVIDLSSSDTGEGTVSPSSLTFTTLNWNSTQQVTVTGVDDDLDDGDISYTITITTNDANTLDDDYDAVDPDDVSVTNTDNDTVGVTVSPTTATTTEAGGTATFTVVLDTEPTNNVVIDLSSSDTGEGTVSPSSLTFTTANWNSTQEVTITGVDDNIDDGDIGYTITITTNDTTTLDNAYDAVDPTDVSATNTDNDTIGVTVSPTTATTTEAGGTATFTVVLNTLPSNNVVIDLSSSDTGEGTVSPSSLTFTTGNWNNTQTVTVTGVDDNIDDGDIAYTITIVTNDTTTLDNDYDAVDPTDVSATNTDNDTAGVTITEALAMTEGATDTYTIVLTSEPTASVTITLADDDDTSVDSNTLTFTTVNWNSAQTVTVTATDDSIAEGEHTGTITHSASSDDANYVITSASITNATATITDNDTAGITVTESDSTTAATEGGTDTYEVVLDSQPTNDVVITITADAQSSVDPATLTFTSADWNTAQTVTITATDDSAVESSHTSTISHTVASDDSNYNAFSISDITLSITDNDEEAAGGGSISILLNNLNQTNTNSGDSTSGDNTSSNSGDTGSTTTTFTDIANHWAQEFIETLYEMEVVDGRTEETFEPNDTITRAELTKIAINIFEYELSTSTVPFSDVTLDHWGYAYIATAYENGFIEGYDNNTFKPDTEINRVEALKILLAAGQVEFDETEIDTVELFFVDIKEDAWYMPYLKYGVLKEIIDAVQTRNEVRPGANITRAEAAKIAVLIHDLL